MLIRGKTVEELTREELIHAVRHFHRARRICAGPRKGFAAHDQDGGGIRTGGNRAAG
jgi:hypothetical protein